MGESPVSAAAMAVGINVALNHSQLAFFSRMNRPSGVLSTDVNLTVAQIKQLREAFDNQSKQMNSGGIPILGSGLKFSPMGIAQNDAQLIEQQRLSFVDICRVYGVPAPLLPETAGGTVGGTEAMINHWLSIGLGSMLTSIEQTIARLFDLRPESRIHFDPAPLLRVDFVGRIEGLVKAVQGGLMTPDEARSTEGRRRIEGGGEGYMQQQMVPLTLLNAMHQATISAKQPQSPPQPIEASLAVARDAIAKAMHHE
jgi:HK97 family phage portal protein